MRGTRGAWNAQVKMHLGNILPQAQHAVRSGVLPLFPVFKGWVSFLFQKGRDFSQKRELLSSFSRAMFSSKAPPVGRRKQCHRSAAGHGAFAGTRDR